MRRGAQKNPKPSHEERVKKREDEALAARVRRREILPVDRSKIHSRSAIPSVLDYYEDQCFTCKDCGKQERWTARRQKRWYEEQGGEIEAIAVRCRACRNIEQERRNNARRVHLEGLTRKAAMTDAKL